MFLTSTIESAEMLKIENSGDVCFKDTIVFLVSSFILDAAHLIWRIYKIANKLAASRVFSTWKKCNNDFPSGSMFF